MHTLAAAFLVTFAALFPIVNPLEGAPLFYVLTRDLPPARQHALARQVALNGLALLLGSMVLGPWLLVFFGIELPVVRIAGGLVVTSLGWKLLSQEQWSDHPAQKVPEDAMQRAGAFYPLTMPLTVGPGSMSVAVSIGSRSKPLSAFSVASVISVWQCVSSLARCASVPPIQDRCDPPSMMTGRLFRMSRSFANDPADR